jgi:hypothetical protein
MKIACALLLVSIIFAHSCALAAEQVDCLELKGFGFPSDTALCIVSPLGVRTGGRNGWILWNHKYPASIITLNPENKTYLMAPLGKEWSRDDLVLQWPKGMVAKKEGATTICGLPCTKYSINTTTGQDCFEFWTCTDTPCDRAGADALSKAMGVPTGYGVPIRVRRLFRKQWITTANVTGAKQVTKPADFFDLDPTYQRAADRAALMFSKNGALKAHDLDDLFLVPTK